MTRRRQQSQQQPTGSRRASREFAFRTLFEAERSGQPLEGVFKRTVTAMHAGEDDTLLPPLTAEALTFARELGEGVDVQWDVVQAALSSTIRGWSFEQMSQTDLNVLRLAAFEMMFLDEAHPPVIESAVRIARKFGGDDSGRFVNGVLADLSRKLERGEFDPVAFQQQPDQEQANREQADREQADQQQQEAFQPEPQPQGSGTPAQISGSITSGPNVSEEPQP